jgi:ABC-type polysaccharide/polyol phosphate transport system ATPase subunit
MWVIKFDDVSKQHRGVSSGPSSIRSGLTRLGRRAAGGSSGETIKYKALDQVSFEIEQGTAVALVGANGAGKSTAMRLASRIAYPTGGKVHVRGRVGALLEVGSGVHPELSGRENIWLYGSIIGIPRAQIRRRFDEIVEFSELEGAIDKQTKFYSSGMQLRMGFAIATFLEPQSLLVDESLATADLNFQLKCIGRLSELVRQGTTLVFVSHEAAAVEALCTRALLLQRGRLVFDGSTPETMAEYLRRLEAERSPGEPADGQQDAYRVVHTACLDADGRPTTRVQTGGTLVVEMTVERLVGGAPGPVEFVITDGRSNELIVCNSADENVNVPGDVGRYAVHCRLDNLPLRPRSYRLWLSTRAANGHREATLSEVAVFRVENPSENSASAEVLHGGPVAAEQSWTVHAS